MATLVQQRMGSRPVARTAPFEGAAESNPASRATEVVVESVVLSALSANPREFVRLADQEGAE